MPSHLSLIRRIKEPTELGELKMQDDTLVCVTGHCGSDPSSRFTTGGKQVTTVNVAVSWGKRPNNTSCWYTIDAWDDQAELLNTFSKGDAISVTGPRKSREYNDKVYWSITAWELSRPLYHKQSGTPKSARDIPAAPPKMDDWDDEEGPPF